MGFGNPYPYNSLDASSNLSEKVTASDVITTNENARKTAEDRDATSADAAQTALDRIATGQDAEDTGNDVTLTHADVVTTTSNKNAAALSETNSATHESNAHTYAINAALSESAANQSKVDTNALYVLFGKQYLGDKASDPSLDNGGLTLTTGALYYNTSSSLLKRWNGSSWVTVFNPTVVQSSGTSEAYVMSQAVITSNLDDIYSRILQSVIPFPSDALFILDGTIIYTGGNYYLQDIKYGRNFLITGYDFPSGWTKGIPYASSATISAPAGSSTLIAADINNFLYSAGGTPNEIPVVSLFQDIDYEHKIFCKHGAEVVNASGVATYAARVSEIIMYATIKAGADLTRCQTYYSVPVEVTSGVKWVSKTGNDTTGNGSKATPWLTVNKAALNMSDNDTIYVKTGSYSEDYAGLGILLRKPGSYIATGFVSIAASASSSATVQMDRDVTILLKGFIISGSRGYGVFASTGTNTIKNCKVINATSLDVYAGGTSMTIDGCVLLTSGNDLYSITATVKSSLVKPTGTKYSVQAFTNTTTLNVLNNTIIPIGTSTYVRCINYIHDGTANIKGNYFDMSALPGQRSIYGTGGYVQTFNIEGNYFYSTALATIGFIDFDPANTSTILIDKNTFVYTNTGNLNSISAIRLNNQVAPTISNNRYSFNTVYGVRAAYVYGSGKSLGTVTISGNYVTTKSLVGHVIYCGSESHTANADKMTPVITNNRISGAYDFGDTNTADIHTIFVGDCLNPTVKYNYLSGCGMGIVLKHLVSGVYSSDIIHSNIVKNCFYGITLAGVDGVKLYNNTIESVISTASAIYVSYHADAATQARNMIIKNNIIKVGSGLAFNFPVGCSVGLVSDYNCIYGSSNVVSREGVLYDFTTWVATSQDANSVSTDPILTNNIPLTAISGTDLGSSYIDGLDVSTSWGSDTTIPVIVTKAQSGTWQDGAYVK